MSDDGLLEEARALLPATVELRRRLHRHPEVGLQLPRTQRTILEEIADLGLEVSSGRSVTSVVAVLEGARPGPTVLLRADMDALPMQERTGLDFASEVDGAMHACGHDTHVAMLVGAARLLAARRRDLAGRVVLMFQPGEEGHHGARFMLDEGLLDETAYAVPVRAAFALHISTQYPASTINLRPGTLLASADRLRVTVQGRGGHASAPHHTLDPVPIACEMVQAFQTMITRRVSVFDPAVLTVAYIRAGTTHNVIPDTAEMLGTLRTLSKQTRELVRDQIVRVAEGVAAAHGGSAQVEIEAGYPMTVNDPVAAEQARAVAAELIGEDAVNVLAEPLMGAEDFSYVLQRVPGAMAFLGACPPDLDPETAPANHSSRVVFDEDALPVGVATYAALALRELARPAAG
ncbi:MAG TPA: M20 family metallopeptidase [Actinomycetes bacterium]|jgi:hippurate hydrolase|nr:M20 family metallopeptidase [Actinomycetes bacterium]